MFQSIDPAATPAPDPEKLKASLEELKGLSLGDFINRIAEGTVELVIHITLAVLVFYAGRFFITRIHRLLTSMMVRRKIDLSLSTFILSMVRIVLYFILIITVISILGIPTSSFLALFASAGVAIGMALSGTLQNFAGGILILLLKPYRIGDFIEAQGYSGTVKEIQIFHTIITTGDNKTIIIPNGGLSTGSINNWSHASTRRISWDIGISYGDSVDDARRTILAMLDQDPRVVKGKKYVTSNPLIVAGAAPAPDLSPVVLVSSLADSAVILQVRAWAATSDYWDIYFEFNERFYNELPKAGIHFPFPQLDVHIDSSATPAS